MRIKVVFTAAAVVFFLSLRELFSAMDIAHGAVQEGMQSDKQQLLERKVVKNNLTFK
jgi:hypothetical protein